MVSETKKPGDASFREVFENISLIMPRFLLIFLTSVEFPDISRFSRQVVTLKTG